MSARRGFTYQLTQIEHDLIDAAAREHNCQPRDVIVRAVAAFAPQAVVAVDREVKHELRQLASVITAPRVEHLTSRESEVLLLMAQGLSNKLIAAKLSISDHTAKFHVNSLAKKLGVGTRTAIVVESMQRGWLVIERPEQVPTIGGGESGIDNPDHAHAVGGGHVQNSASAPAAGNVADPHAGKERILRPSAPPSSPVHGAPA